MSERTFLGFPVMESRDFPHPGEPVVFSPLVARWLYRAEDGREVVALALGGVAQPETRHFRVPFDPTSWDATSERVRFRLVGPA